MQNKKFIDYNLLSKKDQEQLLGVAIGGEEKRQGIEIKDGEIEEEEIDKI